MDNSFKRKFSNKRVNAEKEGISFELSYDEYVGLAKEAGISVDDIGNKGYHLARYNDTGPYKVGNCRFIFYLENLKEKKISERSREHSRNLYKYNNYTFEERSQFVKNSEKFQEYLKRRKFKEEKINLEKDAGKHPSYKGSNNSQFGTCWITNGTENKKIKKEDLDEWLLMGYHKGRNIRV